MYFGTSSTLMDDDASYEYIDSDYIIRKLCITSGLYNPKSVNHPVESQQKGVVNDSSGLYNPESVKYVRGL